MRRASLRLPGAFVALAAVSAPGCSDSLPSEVEKTQEIVRFALSDADAMAFTIALDDVRGRILPGMSETESMDALASLVGELTVAIGTRDRMALRNALARTESALSRLNAVEDSPITPELDAVHLILDQARPLAAGETKQ
jgi:hypothetical protein